MIGGQQDLFFLVATFLSGSDAITDSLTLANRAAREVAAVELVARRRAAGLYPQKLLAVTLLLSHCGRKCFFNNHQCVGNLLLRHVQRRDEANDFVLGRVQQEQASVETLVDKLLRNASGRAIGELQGEHQTAAADFLNWREGLPLKNVHQPFA